MATTWNPADRTNATLSGGNLIAQFTAAGGVRSVFSASTGKWYWETLLSGAATNISTGMATFGAVLSSVATAAAGAVLAYNGVTWINGATSGTGVAFSSGITVCVAVDAGAKLIWFRSGAAGNWNGNVANNPATGVGGLNIAALALPLFAIVATSASGTAVWTADFGDSAFLGAVPSGFTAGFGTAVAAAQARAMVLA